MKIYFAGSIRGGRVDIIHYKTIINALKKFGHVYTEHISDENLTNKGEELSDIFIHDRDMNWLNNSDIIVADVSNPSHGVGYEIGRAIEKGKKIICLFKDSNKYQLSAMINGSDHLTLIKYTNSRSIVRKINQYFNKIKL
jgi:nucleoside 2-deoxyribosyltransferase